jgi:hypothetical protein
VLFKKNKKSNGFKSLVCKRSADRPYSKFTIGADFNLICTEKLCLACEQGAIGQGGG